MAVRDLLWGCPFCREPGSIRRGGWRVGRATRPVNLTVIGRWESCRACGAAFRRGRGAIIIAELDGAIHRRSPAEWLSLLGPVKAPAPDAGGMILGAERVRVQITRHQEPLRFGGELVGWVEVYDRARPGVMRLSVDGLQFHPDRGEAVVWSPGQITGLQPASSSIQLGLQRHMASVRFTEGSVRLWTQALSDLLRTYHHRHGRDVIELQPSVRTRALERSSS